MSLDPDELRQLIEWEGQIEMEEEEHRAATQIDCSGPACWHRTDDDDEANESIEESLDAALKLMSHLKKTLSEVCKSFDARTNRPLEADLQWDVLGCYMGVEEFLADFEV